MHFLQVDRVLLSHMYFYKLLGCFCLNCMTLFHCAADGTSMNFEVNEPWVTPDGSSDDQLTHGATLKTATVNDSADRIVLHSADSEFNPGALGLPPLPGKSTFHCLSAMSRLLRVPGLAGLTRGWGTAAPARDRPSIVLTTFLSRVIRFQSRHRQHLQPATRPTTRRPSLHRACFDGDRR